jgi:hypothetical protein
MDAFGFFDTEDEHEAVLREAARVLAAGGRLAGGPGHGKYHRRQRLYRVEELRAALEHAGLSVVEVFGNPEGEPFEPTTSSTMWVVAQRGGAV